MEKAKDDAKIRGMIAASEMLDAVERSHAAAAGVIVTDEMIAAGLSVIGGFELVDCWEGWNSKSDLVRDIYMKMASCGQPSPRR
jgi:hypothetical protein